MNTTVLAEDQPPLHTYEPRSQRTFKTDGVRLTVALYGNKDGDWSARQLALPPEQSKEYRDRMGAVLKEQQAYNVHALVMPHEFNARMVGQESFRRDGVRVGNQMLYRNAECPGEGLLLAPNEAAWLTPSNCATGILTRNGRCAVVHFGRWSLFDRQLVEQGYRNPTRPHESVLYTALEHLGARKQETAAEVGVVLFWGTRPEHFPHPIVESPHAEINQSLHKHLRADLGLDLGIRDDEHNGRHFGLDLLRVAILQLTKRGVPPKNIDTDHGYLPQSGVWRDGGAGKPRNGVLVLRHS